MQDFATKETEGVRRLAPPDYSASPCTIFDHILAFFDWFFCWICGAVHLL